MIDLSSVKKSAPKTASGKTHPILPDEDGIMAKHASNVVSCREQIETLEASLEQSTGELKSAAQSHFFRSCNGTDSLPSAYIAVGTSPTDKVQVQMQNKYYPINLSSKGSDERVSAIKQVVGDQFDGLFKQSFSITIDGNAVPTKSAQRFVNALVSVCNIFCAGEAHDDAMDDIESILELHEYPTVEVLTAKECLAPKPCFHSERHHLLDVATNLILNQHLPIGTALKTKGVK
jgi:hypothetical protein